MASIDEDFEFELRALPGVVSVALSHRESGDVDTVTLSVNGQDPETVRRTGLHIASFYYPEADVVVKLAGADLQVTPVAGAGISLIQSDFNEQDGVSVIRLSYGGRVGNGRSLSGPLVGGAEATLSAMRELGCDIPCYLMSVTNISTTLGWAVIVVFRATSTKTDLVGLAESEGELLVASAEATLDALSPFVLALDRRGL